MATKNVAIAVELNLDDGTFTAKMMSAAGAVEQFQSSIGSASGAVDRGSYSFGHLATRVIEATAIFDAFSEAMRGVRDLFLEWPKQIVETSSELQRMQTLFQGLSNATDEMTRKKEGGQMFDWVKNMAESVPFSLKAISQAFTQMKVVGIDPMKGSLQAVSDAIAKFGGSDDKMKSAGLAIMEMAGRGVVSLQQLRRQLTLAIPNAIQMMATGMGMTYGQLVDKIKSGSVESTDAIKKMLAVMEASFAGQGLLHMQNFYAQMSVMQTEWLHLVDVIANPNKTPGGSPFMKVVDQQLADLISLMRSGAFDSIARQYGDALSQMVLWLRQALVAAANFHNEIETVGKAFVEYLGVAVTGMILTRLRNGFIALVGVSGRLSMAFASLQRWTYNLFADWRAASDLAMTMSERFDQMAITARAFGVALTEALPVIGQVAMAIFLLAQATGLFDDKAKEASNDIENGIVTQRAVNLIKERIGSIQTELQFLERLQQRVNAGTTTKSDQQYMTANPLWQERLAQDKVELAKFQKDLADGTKQLAKNAAENAAQIADQAYAAADIGISNNFNRLQAKIVKQTKELETQHVALGDPRYAALHQQLIAGAKQEYEARIKLTEDYIKKYQEMQKAGGAAAIEGARLEQQAYQRLSSLRAAMKEQLSGLMAKSPDGAADKTLKAYTSTLQSLKDRLAEVTAKTKGLGVETAKMTAEIASGKFEKATQPQKDALLKEAAALDAATAAQKKHQSSQHAMTTSMGELTKKASEAQTRLAAINVEFMAGKTSQEGSQYRQYVAALDELAKKAIAAGADVKKVNDLVTQASQGKANELQEQQLMKYALATKKINDSLVADARARRTAAYNEQIRQIDELLAKSKLTGAAQMHEEQVVADYKKALSDKLAADNETTLEKMATDWGNYYDNLDKATGKWANDSMNAVMNFVKTGKFQFASLVESILMDLLKIQMEKAAAPALNAIGGWLGGLFGFGGGSSGAGAAAPTPEPNAVGMVPQNHSGGIVGVDKAIMRLVDPSIFDAAPRFHTGMFPNLSSDEYPTILQQGEGVFTQAQMAALGKGQGNGVNVQVNVINQSGTPVSAQAGNTRFDGQGYILDVVLKNLQSPTDFRDGVKGALRS